MPDGPQALIPMLPVVVPVVAKLPKLAKVFNVFNVLLANINTVFRLFVFLKCVHEVTLEANRLYTCKNKKKV